MGQGHTASALRGWTVLTFVGPLCSSILLGKEGTEAWGSEMNWGPLKRGVQELLWDLGCQGRVLGSRDGGSGSEKVFGEFFFATHLFWNILKLDLKWLLTT